MFKIKDLFCYLLLTVPLCLSCSDPKRSSGSPDDEDNGDSDVGGDSDADTDADDDSVCDDESFEVLEGGYVCAGQAHGYAWTSTGEVEGGTIEPSEFSTLASGGDLCVTGTTATDYSSIGILGVSANQVMHTDTNDTWSPSGDGIDVTIEKNGSFPVRFQVNTTSGDYCTEIDNGASSVKWSDLTEECWSSGGAVYNGTDPIELIMLMVPGDQDAEIDFDLCLNELIAGVGGQSTDEDSDTAEVDLDGDDCTTADKTICENEIAKHCGYTYEFWRDAGGGCMTATSGGGFSIDWNDNNNVLARKGIRPGSDNLVVTYEADYSAGGTSYLGVYGWTQNPLVEYYILDNWGDWRPQDGTDALDSIESDGGTYQLYRTRRVNEPSIEGDSSTFDQYWSVRTSKRTSGTITVGNHFDAWTSNGLDMGRLYEVSMVVEGYLSAGSADVKMSMDTR